MAAEVVSLDRDGLCFHLRDVVVVVRLESLMAPTTHQLAHHAKSWRQQHVEEALELFVIKSPTPCTSHTLMGSHDRVVLKPQPFD